MGIEQLVDTFKGNPQPLEAKVQRDNKGQPPGAVPRDLQEVIALQEIAKVRQGMQNQQAMQAGGAQPSVAEKLRQMVGAMRAQGQPQMAQAMPRQMPGNMPQQTVMAAGGGSLDQLISNLGRHYAGGGIIAFDDGGRGEDKDPDAEGKKPLRYYPLSEQGADYVARKQAAREAKVKDEERRQALVSQIPTGGQQAPAASTEAPDTELTRNVNNAMAAMPGASAAKGFAGGIRGLMAMIGALGNRENKVAPEAPGPYMDSEVEKLKRLAANPAAAQNTNPALQPRPPAAEAPPANKPNVGGGDKPGINTNKPVAEAMDPMEIALRAAITKALGRDADQEFEKGAKRNQEFMGLDRLLQPREARIAEREGMLKKIQGERLPDWVAGFDRASKPIVSGGIGTLINQYGTGKQEQKKAYDTEDLKFFDQIGDMKDEVVKLKLEGKYKAAAAGEAAIKDMLADKRQAEQSGTSLLNTKENVRSREQVARDAAAARAQSARQHSENQALALEERKRQFNESELRKIREKDVDRSTKIETAIAKRVGNIDLQLQMPNIKPEVEADLLRRRNAIVKQVQAEYPSVKPDKPSEGQFLAAARAANPGVSEAELKAYYKKTYGS
jgi:hypothetical protein